MADDDQTSEVDSSKETPHIDVPLHDSLPPPPEVNFIRPTLKKGVAPLELGTGPRADSSDGMDSSEQSGGSAWGRGLSVSVTFAASIIAGFMLGQWVDHHLFHNSSQIWGTLILSLLGFAVGFYNVVRLTSGWGKGRK